MMRLSPSKLNILVNCSRCFYDANVRGIARPRGPFPSLPGGIDRTLKKYFDMYRGSMPPEFEGKLPGVLFQHQEILKRWRNWRTGLEYRDNDAGVYLIGALDDCLVDGEVYSPLDYKTKGSRPKTDGSEYYQTQMDCYMLMLEANGYKTRGKAYLAYVWPEGVQNSDGAGAPMKRFLNYDFGVEVYELQDDAERAKLLIRRAVEVLGGDRPEAAPGCEYCEFIKEHSNKM